MRLLSCGDNEVSLESKIPPFLGHLFEGNSFDLPRERAPLPELSISASAVCTKGCPHSTLLRTTDFQG